ncbi:MAG: oligosaccharide flippase family protein [Intestinibacillus sp.]
MHRKKQNFVEGAFILLLANLLVKVIGALFQIPLKNMIGSDGFPAFGLFSMSYRIYMAMLVVSTVGLPAALSKMVAEATTLGREHEVRRIVKVAACVFVPVGAVCSLLLYFGAGTLAGLIQSPDATLAVQAIAPSVLMVAILSVFRGYYQGKSNMVPTAVSQVIESLGKLFVGLGLAFMGMRHGLGAPMVAALTVLGVTVGEVIAALYMIVQGLLRGRHTRSLVLNDAVRSPGTICKNLLMLSIPITISSAVMSVTDLIDVALISTRLQDIGMSKDLAASVYGVYTGMAVNFFNLPQTLVTALAISALPAIAGANASQNFTRISKTMGTTFRLTMMITLPAGAGFLILAEPVLRLVYHSDTALAGPLMQILGLAVPCVAVVAITNATLQALGRADLPLISMFLGALVKLFSDYTLLGNPHIGITGAPVSTTLCYALIALLNLFQIGRLTRALPPLGKTVLRPLASTIGMGAATVICFQVCTRALGAVPGSMADKGITLLSIVVAVAVYVVLLLSLHAIERDDILLMPGGEKIANLLHLK